MNISQPSFKTELYNFVRALVVCGFLYGALPWHTVRAEATLNLFTYSEYIDPEVVKEFEQRFDCKLVIDTYEEAEAMLAKMQGGGASVYDVVIATDYVMPALLKLKLLAPLPHDAVPNLKNLEPRFLSLPCDPGNRYSAAYQWGTTGIYVRKNGPKNIPPTWGLFFDAKLQLGDFVLIDSMRDTIGAALKYKGYSFNSTDPKELKEARDLVIEAKKRCTGFAASVGGKNKVLDKSARAAIVYSGEGGRGMSEDAGTVYMIPREGSNIWVDSMAILAQAPHKELAAKFINYILLPEPGAKISNFTQFATPNAAARKLIKPELLRNPAIYPPDDILAKLEFLKDLGKETWLYDQVWLQIKAR